MRAIVFCLFLFGMLASSCSPKIVSEVAEEPKPDISKKPMPEITFKVDTIHLGRLVKGAKAPMVFEFTNTGDSDLIIEIVTTCKCTSIDWPREPIPPGGTGKITATYDTTDQALGQVRKTLDVVANTDPLLVEAFFTAEVVAP